jgi:hypothetical protein
VTSGSRLAYDRKPTTMAAYQAKQTRNAKPGLGVLG